MFVDGDLCTATLLGATPNSLSLAATLTLTSLELLSSCFVLSSAHSSRAFATQGWLSYLTCVCAATTLFLRAGKSLLQRIVNNLYFHHGFCFCFFCPLHKLHTFRFREIVFVLLCATTASGVYPRADNPRLTYIFTFFAAPCHYLAF